MDIMIHTATPFSYPIFVNFGTPPHYLALKKYTIKCVRLQQNSQKGTNLEKIHHCWLWRSWQISAIVVCWYINEIFVKDFCNVTLLQEETFKKIPPQGCNLQGWEKNTKPFFFFPLCIEAKVGRMARNHYCERNCRRCFCPNYFLLILFAPNAHFIALNSSVPAKSFEAFIWFRTCLVLSRNKEAW